MSKGTEQTNKGCSSTAYGVISILLSGFAFIFTLGLGMATGSSPEEYSTPGYSALLVIGMVSIPVLLLLGVGLLIRGGVSGVAGISKQFQENEDEETQVKNIADARKRQARNFGLATGFLITIPMLNLHGKIEEVIIDIFQYNIDFAAGYFLVFVVYPILGYVGGERNATIFSKRMKEPMASILGGVAGCLLFSLIGLPMFVLAAFLLSLF